MENASKALIMAGGILIGIMILSLLVYTFTNFASFTTGQNREEIQRQLVIFNQQYEEKMRDDLKASDIISIINMAKNNNTKHEITDINDPNYIQIIIECATKTYRETTAKNILYDEFLKDNSASNQFFRYVEPSSGESIYNESGRVCKLKFKLYEI